MILNQTEIMTIMPKLLQKAQHQLSKEGLRNNLPLLRQKSLDFAAVCEDAMVPEKLPAEACYCFQWEIKLLENELPIVNLALKITTPTSQHIAHVSSPLITLFTDYFIATGRIPNPWLIS